MSKSKLHQLLAVEPDLKGVYLKIMAETGTNFKKHQDRYFQYHQRTELFDAADPEEADVHKTMDDTVPAKLDYTADHIIRYLDAVLQKEATNQLAVANIVIEEAGVNRIIAEGVPATYLLGLEKLLATIRDTVYTAIPTLQPGVAWEVDSNMPAGVVKKRDPDEKFRTKKIRKNHVVALATDKHKEQVEVYTEDVKVAKILTDTWCSKISSKEKAALLARVERLLGAVKSARQVANSTEVKEIEIGAALFDYIHFPIEVIEARNKDA